MRRFDLPPIAEYQSAYIWLTLPYRGQAPSHIFNRVWPQKSVGYNAAALAFDLKHTQPHFLPPPPPSLSVLTPKSPLKAHKH